jgi:hypothetical protein
MNNMKDIKPSDMNTILATTTTTTTKSMKDYEIASNEGKLFFT